MKTSELVKLLMKSGANYLVSHGGEHDRWYSEITGKRYSVPRHGSKEIPSGTVNRILKDAGLK